MDIFKVKPKRPAKGHVIKGDFDFIVLNQLIA
jgi:hypothetical protein